MKKIVLVEDQPLIARTTASNLEKLGYLVETATSGPDAVRIRGERARLRDMVPEAVIMVGESGIKNADDVARMAEIGVGAILVGETLVRSKNTYNTTRSLVEAGRP